MVTSAASLIQGVVHHFADDYKGCVQLAVSRLSRVRLLSLTFCEVPINKILSLDPTNSILMSVNLVEICLLSQISH